MKLCLRLHWWSVFVWAERNRSGAEQWARVTKSGAWADITEEMGFNAERQNSPLRSASMLWLTLTTRRAKTGEFRATVLEKVKIYDFRHSPPTLGSNHIPLAKEPTYDFDHDTISHSQITDTKHGIKLIRPIGPKHLLFPETWPKIGSVGRIFFVWQWCEITLIVYSYILCIGLNCIGLSRYIAITNLSIIAVFVEYLRQFLIDLNQIYRHSCVPQNTSPWIFWAF